MVVNKVIYEGRTLIDLTADTVTPQTLAQGVTAHDKAGNAIVGTMQSSGSADSPIEIVSVNVNGTDWSVSSISHTFSQISSAVDLGKTLFADITFKINDVPIVRNNRIPLSFMVVNGFDNLALFTTTIHFSGDTEMYQLSVTDTDAFIEVFNLSNADKVDGYHVTTSADIPTDDDTSVITIVTET